ncbi:periplasmic heavy metal sensor [Dyadobacter sp. 32]|uniref:periplasmic heavy metal sensor n=1 Tax=Dyadobacter sp. 32 TaxID=538966 RepID=UPI0011ED1F5E
MSKVKLLSVAVALLLVTNFVILFLLLRENAGHPRNRQSGGAEPKMIVIDRLHLDKMQVEQYEKLVLGHRSDVRGLEAKIRDAKTRLYGTLVKENKVEKEILEDSLAHLQRQMEDVHYNHFVEIKRLCKPDQLPYFNELTRDLATFFTPKKKLQLPPKD